MKKIYKWGFASICLISMANFMLFLGNKSIFMSNIDSYTYGWDTNYLYTWPWEGNNSNSGGVPGPYMQASQYQNVTYGFSIECSNQNTSTVITESTKSHTYKVGGQYKVLEGSAQHTGTTSSGSSSGSSSGNRKLLSFTYAPSETVYDIVCQVPLIAPTCTPVNGWTAGIQNFMETVVNPIVSMYGY